MQSPDFRLTVKEFLVKSLEFILSSRVPSPPSAPSAQPCTPFLQLRVAEKHGVRGTQTGLEDLEAQFRLRLEIVRSVEGCHPVLLERWEFSFDPTAPYTGPDSNETLIKKLVLSLRSLLCASLQLPASFLYSRQLTYGLYLNIDGFMTWPARMKPRSISTWPGFELQTPVGCLTVRCAYLPNPPDPEIIPQSLGSRQRLISIETEETKDFPDSKALFGSWSENEQDSAPSTDSNPPFSGVCGVDREKSAVSSCTLSQALLPHIDSLLEEPKDSNSDLDFPGEDLSHRKGSEESVPEAAQVAVFSLQCTKRLKKGLFASAEPLTDGLSSLKQAFLGLKSAKEELIEKQRRHFVRN